MELRWKEGFFSSKYHLLREDEEVGEMNFKLFSSTEDGLLNSERYLFKRKGVFNNKVEIIESESQEVVGEIIYHSLKSEAEVELGEKRYLWKFDNLWSSKWSLNDGEEALINYRSKFMKGQLNSSTENNILILSGLHIYSYYLRVFVSLTVMVIIICSN